MKKTTKMTAAVIKAAAKSNIVGLKGYDPDIGIFYALHKVINGKDVFTLDNDRGPLLYAYQKQLYMAEKFLQENIGKNEGELNMCASNKPKSPFEDFFQQAAKIKKLRADINTLCNMIRKIKPELTGWLRDNFIDCWKDGEEE